MNKNRGQILWIDDEIDLLKPHVLFLEEKGYSITKCNNGKDGISIFDQNVFDLIEIESEKSNISLIYDKNYSKPINVFADEERILQVLTNLLVNSLKYGIDGGRTEVSLVRNDDKVLIRVSDDGIGVSKEHLPRLFERFYRV